MIKKSNIAVIGAGISGIAAAHILQREHEVTLYEQNNYAGGHTNTITLVDGPDAGTCIDTGFIVFNDRNYPLFSKFLSQLDVAEQPSDMSFGFSSVPDNFCYSSYMPWGLLAQKRNLFRPAFYSMVQDILRFNKQSLLDFHEGRLLYKSLGAYLDEGRYSRPFRNFYLIPMGAAIWSTPLNEMLDFPAHSFVQFFNNHGLLELKNRPRWKTIPGGSHVYVKKFLAGFRGSVRTGCGVVSLSRDADGVRLRTAEGREETFDYAVVAAHADQALRMLADPTSGEKRLLGAWRYSSNKVYLHTDTSFLPENPAACASWNYRIEGKSGLDSPVTLTYDMNRLQSLKTSKQYLVTLNPVRPVGADHIIREIDYTHPVYTLEALESQKQLETLNGVRRTFFCGSYFGYGFHEDGARAGVQAAKHFGIDL